MSANIKTVEQLSEAVKQFETKLDNFTAKQFAGPVHGQEVRDIYFQMVDLARASMAFSTYYPTKHCDALVCRAVVLLEDFESQAYAMQVFKDLGIAGAS